VIPGRRGRPGWTLLLTSMAAFMTALDALVVATALPAIHRELGGSVSTLEWVVNAYLLAFAAGIITAASLGDRLGRRRMYVVGLALFTAASAACALAPSAGILIGARALQGVGAALVTPLSLTLLTTAFPPERRGSVLGIWGAITGLAVAGGPLIGGAVTQGLNWHWIFWVNVPIGALAAVLSTRLLAESRGPAARLDLPGAALITMASVALAWGLVRANDVGWASPEVAATLVTGVVLLLGFASWERRTPYPMLPLHLFRNRSFAAANATGFLMTGAITSAAFLVSQYFQFARGDSPLSTGLRFLPWTATPLLVAPLAGAASDRIGRRPLMVVGLLLQAIGLAWFALLATDGVGYARLVLPLVIAGVGISMALPTTTTAALSAVPLADIGRAAGVANSLQRFGGVFGVAVASAVFAINGHLTSPAAVIAGFRPALVVAAVLSLAGAACALAVGARRPSAVMPAPSVLTAGDRETLLAPVSEPA
jgi:EmrB/QacA subfamily drug resistance transporter